MISLAIAVHNVYNYGVEESTYVYDVTVKYLANYTAEPWAEL